MENDKIDELNLFDLVNKLGYIKWIGEYSEKHHHLSGWIDRDNYLDEVELPVELNLALIQTFLRENHNTHIEIRLGHDEDKIWYDWSMFNITKGYSYEPHLTNENNGFDTYELALLDALLESSMFLINLPI